jgi:hypothetical protein
MTDKKSGDVSMVRDGQKYTGSYTIENDSVQVSTEIGTLSRPLRGMPAKELAQQLLAKLVDEEIRSLR